MPRLHDFPLSALLTTCDRRLPVSRSRVSATRRASTAKRNLVVTLMCYATVQTVLLKSVDMPCIAVPLRSASMPAILSERLVIVWRCAAGSATIRRGS